MKLPPTFRWPGWLAGSLFALVAANCFLVLFVAGIDVFLGRPPQFAVPLVALLVASGSLVLSRQRQAPAAGDARDISAATTGRPENRRRANAPAYVAMTVIRRSPALNTTAKHDCWKGIIR